MELVSPPPNACRNSAGVRYPSELCGRSQLYSSRQLATVRRTSPSMRNQLTFKHSSRSHPWKLSTWPFCIGRPGWRGTSATLRSSVQPSMRREQNSGPLSKRTLSGLPRSSISCSSNLRHPPAAQARVGNQGQALTRVRVEHAQCERI